MGPGLAGQAWQELGLAAATMPVAEPAGKPHLQQALAPELEWAWVAVPALELDRELWLEPVLPLRLGVMRAAVLALGLE